MSHPGPDSPEPSPPDRPEPESKTAHPYRVRRATAADQQYSSPADSTPTPQAPLPQPPIPQVPQPPPPPSYGPAQASAPKRRGALFIGIAAALITVLAIGGGVAYALNRAGAAGPVQAEAPGGRKTQASQSPGPSAPTTPPSAASQLKALSAKGTATAKADLDGKWVPQISAKRKGLVVAGKAWSERDILDEFNDAQARYGDALMIRSGDFTTFKRSGFYVTLINRPAASPAPALSWCAQHNYGHDDCFAKLVSTTHGVGGATKMQD